MTKKKPKVNDLVKRELSSNQIHHISESFKREIQNAPIFKNVTKFLWFPKTINGKTKWLTKATWLEEFKQEIDYDALNLGTNDCLVWSWVPTKWIEK